jgi:hypothetical protein
MSQNDSSNKGIANQIDSLTLLVVSDRLCDRAAVKSLPCWECTGIILRALLKA